MGSRLGKKIFQMGAALDSPPVKILVPSMLLQFVAAKSEPENNPEQTFYIIDGMNDPSGSRGVAWRNRGGGGEYLGFR